MSSTTRLGGILQSRRDLGAILIGAIILALPSLLNGRPFVFPDTAMYLGFGGIVTHLDPTHFWASLFGMAGGPSGPDELSDATRHLAASHMAARSLVYAVFLTVLASLTTIYGVLAVQCGLTSALIWRFSVRMIGTRPSLPAFALLIAGLTVFTPLGVTANLILPDAYTAPLILLLALLIADREPLDAGRAIVAGFALSVLIAFHTSHLLIAVGTLAAGLAAKVMIDRSLPRQVGWGIAVLSAAAVVLAMAEGLAATAIATHQVGLPLYRPPVFSARVIDDGPGRAILAKGCDHHEFAICDDAPGLRARAPRSGDSFLWADKVSTGGGYLLASESRQDQLRREEPRFVTTAILQHPVQQVIASLKNIATLLVKDRIDVPYSNLSFTYDFYHSTKWLIGGDTLLSTLPNMDRCKANPSRVCGTLPLHLLTAVYYPVIGISVMACVFVAFTARGKPRTQGGALATVLVLTAIGGILANDIVCAVLSGPYDRYQTRVIWLLCLAPILALWSRRRSREISP